LCAELVFNLDEIEISEWEDCVEKKVMVPTTKRAQAFSTVCIET
jgi:hypothetical protein